MAGRRNYDFRGGRDDYDVSSIDDSRVGANRAGLISIALSFGFGGRVLDPALEYRYLAAISQAVLCAAGTTGRGARAIGGVHGECSGARAHGLSGARDVGNRLGLRRFLSGAAVPDRRRAAAQGAALAPSRWPGLDAGGAGDNVTTVC